MAEHIVIKSSKSISDILRPSEIYKYKDLLVELTSKDIKMRHKQTILGVAWVLFQPLISVLIFTLIFGVIIKLPTDKIPYPLFVFIGFNFWNLFSNTITSVSGSLAGNESLIKKVYFPRVIIPLSTIATNLFDFTISSAFLLIMIAYFGLPLSFTFFIYFFTSVVIVFLTCTGLGLFLASLNLRYRDVRQILPFFIQILIFLTPVFYPVTSVSAANRWILSLNPLSTAIELTRYGVGGVGVSGLSVAVSLLISSLLCIIGVLYFAKTEEGFADLI